MLGVFQTIDQMRVYVGQQKKDRATVALVPTMGALHEGHLKLVETARAHADRVIVSIFVNPLQFGPTEDLAQYPRTFEEDMAKLESHADAVFFPTVAELYPQGDIHTRVANQVVGSMFEGASRPGHFDGVLTVVAKLFGIVQPDFAVFGQKDAQQLFLVKQMVADLNFPVKIIEQPTEREPSGLARSSRNRYLDAAQMQAASVLFAALSLGSQACAQGVGGVIAAARAHIEATPQVRLEYLALVDANSFQHMASNASGRGLLLVAARVGSTRLIDNIPVCIPSQFERTV